MTTAAPTPTPPFAASPETSTKAGPAEPAGSRSPARRLTGVRRHGPATWIAAAWLAVVALAALFPSLLAPGDGLEIAPSERLAPPGLGHPFGTDQLGRDLYVRIVDAAASTLAITVSAVLFGLVVGALLGIVAATLRGPADWIVLRIVEVVSSIPSLLLALVIITALGPGPAQVAVAVGLALTANFARLVRGEVLRVLSTEYVEAARALGFSLPRVIVRHVLPHARPPVLGLAIAEFGMAVLSVSALGFLGLGPQPPAADWGSLIADGRGRLTSAWWMTAIPGLVVVSVVLAAGALRGDISRQSEDGKA